MGTPAILRPHNPSLTTHYHLPKMLSVRELAAVIGMKPSQIRKLAGMKKIPHFRFETRGNYFFDPQEVAEWVRDHRVESMTP